MKVKSLYILLGMLLLGIAFGCNFQQKETAPKYDLEQILDSGVLRVITLYGSTSYFQYRGQEMGFQYELASQFAEYLDLKLEVLVANNIDEMRSMLLQGKGDLIAFPLPYSAVWKDSLVYCGEETITHQVLVQRNRWRPAPLKERCRSSVRRARICEAFCIEIILNSCKNKNDQEDGDGYLMFLFH